MVLNFDRVIATLKAPMQELADRPELASFRNAIGDVASSVQELAAQNSREQYAAAKLQLERLKHVQAGVIAALPNVVGIPPGGPRRDPTLDGLNLAITALEQLVMAIAAEANS